MYLFRSGRDSGDPLAVHWLCVVLSPLFRPHEDPKAFAVRENPSRTGGISLFADPPDKRTSGERVYRNQGAKVGEKSIAIRGHKLGKSPSQAGGTSCCSLTP